ncbi:Transcriptional regulatory protein RprY [Tenacibaculum sp. 190130A14a]|uniref:Transcriptional regulatory protein RprY n=1 Tax=Tenacibaculum polynesiense TaxID=3137857 RepID=A0ABP1F1F2_9FLAO
MRVNHVLLVEDDLDFGNILKQYLEISEYKVTWAKDGLEAIELLGKINFHICVLDVMMPKMDGFSLAEKMVEIYPEIPFVFLTARKMKEDRMKGLKLGADDYIVKPFEADELVLRLKNILKRTNGIANEELESSLEIGLYHFNPHRLELRLNDELVKQLTEKEGELILYLFQNKNRLLKREEILKKVWKSDDYFSGRSMDVFISRLRKYFKEDPKISIQSSRGVGLEFKIG